jgi:hypothetical protein
VAWLTSDVFRATAASMAEGRGSVGLIRGLEVHPATAWFAVLELVVPVAIAGWLLT